MGARWLHQQECVNLVVVSSPGWWGTSKAIAASAAADIEKTIENPVAKALPAGADDSPFAIYNSQLFPSIGSKKKEIKGAYSPITCI